MNTDSLKETGLHDSFSELGEMEGGLQGLRASELSYRRLFETAKDGILILDAETGRINDVNPFLVTLLGFSREKMIGKTVGELSPFKDIEANKVMLERLQKVGYVRYEDLPLETHDGRHVDVEFVSNVYQAGSTRVIQCNIRDITERKQAAMAVILLAAIVAYSDDAIIGKDMDGIITSWNIGAEKVFGYTSQEMVGVSILKLIPSDRQDEEAYIMSEIKLGRSVVHLETLRQTKDGRTINISVTESPIKDPAGHIIGASKVARDITERVAAGKTILELNSDLEQRITERTRELQAANEELQAFGYSISHDLRAPLRHVLGYINMLIKEAGPLLSEKSLRHLATISLSAERMGELIDDLLAFSRLGRVELEKKDVSLDELVRETMGDFKAEAKNRHIVWKILPLPTVWAGRALLRMALVNLISNAIKFTSPREEAVIEIGCASDKNDQTAIYIRDNGVGFDAAYVDQLFGVFQRLHTRKEFEGTGIGLANVQRIIHRHGGETWAEGAVDAGATFYFSLPKESKTTHAH